MDQRYLGNCWHVHWNHKKWVTTTRLRDWKKDFLPPSPDLEHSTHHDVMATDIFLRDKRVSLFGVSISIQSSNEGISCHPWKDSRKASSRRTVDLCCNQWSIFRIRTLPKIVVDRPGMPHHPNWLHWLNQAFWLCFEQHDNWIHYREEDLSHITYA